MASSVLITVHGGSPCKSRQGESILSALVRANVVLSAPCGGRGICEKCLLTLLKGKVRLTEQETEVKTGDTFCACKAQALSDITVSLAENSGGDFSFTQLAVMQEGRKIRRAGVGLDIGTTTVQAQLVDLDTGESLQAFSALNDQRSFGADVMSRIGAARNGKTRELFAAINRQVENILNQFINKWNLPAIEQCTVSGNTTMLHLFAGIDPSAMGEAPFTPVFLEERHFCGKELSLSVERITLLPGISAFVGADVVCGLALIDIMKKNEVLLFVDIGTNGEMAAWEKSKRRLMCCSTAAGPCFEGTEISCGMGAISGAINKINLNENKLCCATLGNEKPRGICGAGLIDAIAVMRRLGVIDETGALAEKYARTGFPVADDVVITQKDVRQFQMAKAAIFSGIKTLCKTAVLEIANLEAAYIAGGLGFFIDLKNAVQTGLLPCELIKNAAVCGNTSLKGAVKSLNDSSFLPRCREIVSCASTVELANSSDFAEMFADNMGF